MKKTVPLTYADKLMLESKKSKAGIEKKLGIPVMLLVFGLVTYFISPFFIIAFMIPFITWFSETEKEVNIDNVLAKGTKIVAETIVEDKLKQVYRDSDGSVSTTYHQIHLPKEIKVKPYNVSKHWYEQIELGDPISLEYIPEYGILKFVWKERRL